MNTSTSESCAVVRSFNFSLVLNPKLLFSCKKSRNVEKSLLNLNFEVLPFCSEKSRKLFSSLETPNQCISKDISVNNLEEPSNLISTDKYDNCNINYLENFVKIVESSISASISSPDLSEKASNLALSNFNSNRENLSSSSNQPYVVINYFTSTTELISSSRESSNKPMSRESLVDKLEQPSNVFCTRKYGKYNINTSQQSTDTVKNFSCDFYKVCDLHLSALEKIVTATVCCFNSNPESLSFCSDKSVIATSVSSLNSGKSINDSNLNTCFCS